MKEITKYVANDGAEFNDITQAYARDALIEKVNAIMAQLPSKPDDRGCNFSNGHGFIQHNRLAFMTVRRELLELANEIMPHKWFSQSIADETAHPSYAARMIDEVSGPLQKAWYRIYCTDGDLREWGQPYYALNTDKGEQICLNAK